MGFYGLNLIFETARLVYPLYGLTYEVPSSACLSIYEKKKMSKEVLIIDPETPITREEYEKEGKN